MLTKARKQEYDFPVDQSYMLSQYLCTQMNNSYSSVTSVFIKDLRTQKYYHGNCQRLLALSL